MGSACERGSMVAAGLLVASGLLLVVGCDGTDPVLRPDSGTGELTGADVYENVMPDGNSFACATCHALTEPTADGYRRPGHPIGDAANRPTYKNGQLTSLLEAVNTCVVEWMDATPLTASDERWTRLEAFLEAQAGEAPAEALSFEIVAPPADLSGGDAVAGQVLFDASCAICHGEGATGTERAPSLIGSGVDEALVGRRVRTSGLADSVVYEGLTDGRMPFWAADRLSDAELRDLVAYAVELGALDPPDGGLPLEDAGAPMPDAGPPCEATHAKIGQAAVLSNRFHGVGGTARIVDDCTIVIEDFTYDGRGIDVRIYGGLGGDFGRGFPISEDLLRATPYRGETLTLRLPADRTLDDLDGVSVWCVDAAVSFGAGAFAE